MTTVGPRVVPRCAAHPARPAADDCPVCGRARCGSDAASFGTAGCAACFRQPRTRQVTPGELVVRASAAALATAYVGGWIAAQYVDTQYFAVLAPGLVALACGWAASAATGGSRGARTSAVAVAAGLLATGLSDRLVPGGQNLFLPPGHRLPPYIAAVVGALAWPVLFGPPRGRREQGPRSDQRAGRGMRRQ